MKLYRRSLFQHLATFTFYLHRNEIHITVCKLYETVWNINLWLVTKWDQITHLRLGDL